MPKQSITKYKLPREKGNPAMQPAQSKMCYKCGKVYEGRHKGAHYVVDKPNKYHYIDEEGLAYSYEERKAMGMLEPDNVSHGFCQEGCYEQAIAENRLRAEATTPKEPAIQLEPHMPITEAHTPIPEAHTPIAEAYEPVTSETK